MMASWDQKTYWVLKEPGRTPDHAFVSNLPIETLNTLLDLDTSKNTIIPANKTEPCAGCPQRTACMDSHWVDGKRMSNPPGEASLSEVIECRFCGDPRLTLYRRGDEAVVPLKCPRRTGKIGICDGCTKARGALTEVLDLSENAKDEALSMLGTILEDPELYPVWRSLSVSDRNLLTTRWVNLLGGALSKDFDSVRVTRALVVEMTDGPLEKAWLAKSAASRRFAIRCWEGLIRRAEEG